MALVDWEVAGPVDRLSEVAMAAWNNAQLYDDVAAMNGLPDAARRMRQVRIFADAYGLPTAGRHRLAYRIIEFAAQSAANEVVEQRITPRTEHAPRVWGSRGRRGTSRGCSAIGLHWRPPWRDRPHRRSAASREGPMAAVGGRPTRGHHSGKRNAPLRMAPIISLSVSRVLCPSVRRTCRSSSPNEENCWWSAAIGSGSVSVSPPRARQRWMATSSGGRRTT